MKEKNIGCSLAKSFALLFVVGYHIWVLGGKPNLRLDILARFVGLGGEIGVTLFFLISGYGIYISLHSMEEKYGKIITREYTKKRCKRILPPYYINLFLLLTIGTGMGYVSKELWPHILTHILFVQNLFDHYTINGVLWTMAITIQFYIIAIPLYYCLKKNPYVFLILTILITVLSKRMVYINNVSEVPLLGFNLGRTKIILTVLDNFTLGMFGAWFYYNKKNITGVFPLLGMSGAVILIDFVCRCGQKYGIHTNNWSGYCFHSMLALSLGFFLYFMSCIKFKSDNKIVKLLLFLAKYEYGIYLYHLVFIENYLTRCGLIMELQNRGWYILSYAIMGCLSIVLGVIMDFMVSASMEKLGVLLHEKKK